MVEVMVGSGVLLLMVALASMATISYLRGYGHYTKEGARLRAAAKTLEVAAFAPRWTGIHGTISLRCATR